MTQIPHTDDVRDIWVDYHLDGLPRVEGIALVPEYQAAFDAWMETIRADAREAVKAEYVPVLMEHLRILADLRARVAALWLTSDTDHDYNDGYEAAKRDVLDLFDGGSE